MYEVAFMRIKGMFSTFLSFLMVIVFSTPTFAAWTNTNIKQSTNGVGWADKIGTRVYMKNSSGISYSTVTGSSLSTIAGSGYSYTDPILANGYYYYLRSERNYGTLWRFPATGTISQAKLYEINATYQLMNVTSGFDGTVWFNPNDYLSGSYYGFFTVDPSTGGLVNRGIPSAGFNGYVPRAIGVSPGGTLVANWSDGYGNKLMYYKDGSWKNINLNGNQYQQYASLEIRKSKSDLWLEDTRNDYLYKIDTVNWKLEFILNNYRNLFFDPGMDGFFRVSDDGLNLIKHGSDGKIEVTYDAWPYTDAISYAFLDEENKTTFAFGSKNAMFQFQLGDQAALDAKAAAEAAKRAAEDANNTTNNIISPKLDLVNGAVRDASGNTVVTIANWANMNADAARIAAIQARDNSSTASQNALFIK